MNKVILIGNLGQDAEVGSTNSGTKYARLSVATSVSWKDRDTGERREKTQWHRVVCWGDGLCKFIGEAGKKGRKVAIEGKLQTRKWQDRDGKDRYTTEVVIQGPDCSFTMLTKLGTGGVPVPDDEPDGRFSGDYEPSRDAHSGPPRENFQHNPYDDEIPF